ncbi:hypothetical protein [Mesorhizobium sp. INR15]|uniref:hypothetical protein n=1 Tax=Mesorhizobium sp. INR15 TaxID=2654248 RepID=UPI0018966F8C|nr:hypothetical protein [Mesorhizobium sp. INR15]QPC91916.1 hypothetical protein GA829_15735 [Mesorhizobium sp. INR15]
MKGIFLSALVAISAVSPAIVAPAQAASVVITTDNNMDMGRHYGRDHRWRDHHWRKHHDRYCFIKVRKHWRHHHWVIEKVRVCDVGRF